MLCPSLWCIVVSLFPETAHSKNTGNTRCVWSCLLYLVVSKYRGLWDRSPPPRMISLLFNEQRSNNFYGITESGRAVSAVSSAGANAPNPAKWLCFARMPSPVHTHVTCEISKLRFLPRSFRRLRFVIRFYTGSGTGLHIPLYCLQ